MAERTEYACELVGEAAEQAPGTYNVVVSSEVIEHVPDQRAFVQHCADLVAPGGVLVMTTLDRSALSWLGAILVAEHITGMIKPGTHEWGSFVQPTELCQWMEDAGMEVIAGTGFRYWPLSGVWQTCGMAGAMNYGIAAMKRLPQHVG